jgi:hypothetical protein
METKTVGGTWTKEASFATGAIRSKEILYFAMTDDELRSHQDDHTFFVLWNKGEWGGGDVGRLQWNPTGVVVVQKPLLQGLLIGEWGDCFCAGSGERHTEKIRDGKIDPADRGPLSGVGLIEGKAYAVGTNRQVYRRDGKDQWTCIDKGASLSEDSDDIASFEAIDGYSGKDIYAAGLGGEIWHYNGKKWSQIDSPTNVPLTKVCCAGDGKVYVCGRNGLVIRGRGDEWEKIDHDGTGDDFWGAAWFQNTLYLATRKSLFTVDGEELKPVDFDDETPSSFYHLDAREGLLLSTGPKDLMLFDGKAWTRID